MQVKINGDKDDLSMILVSAERYALGRRTYIVHWTCKFIEENIHLLSNKDKQVIIRDLESAVFYGDDCDEKDWKKLLAILKEEK